MPTLTPRKLRRAPLLVALIVTLATAGAAQASNNKGGARVKGRVSPRIMMTRNHGMKIDGYSITTDAGKRYEVKRTDKTKALDNLAGQKVEAVGSIAGAALTVEQFHRIESWRPAYKGAKRAAIIRLSYASQPGVYKQSVATLRSKVFDGASSLAKMWARESRGRLSLTGDVFSEVLPAGTNDGCTFNSNNGTGIVAGRHPGYDFYLFVSNEDCFGGTGAGDILGPYSWYWGGMNTYSLWHEMGHNLGFHHSNELGCTAPSGTVPMGPSCNSSEYGDTLTVMGMGDSACTYSAYQDIIADWGLPYSQVNSDATVQLLARNLDDNGTPRAIIVPGAPAGFGGYYILDWRTSDAGSCASKGVKGLQIRVAANAQAGQHSHLVDMRPLTDTANDAPLKVGETFYDPNTNLSIKLVSQNLSTGVASVQVKFNDPPPPPNNTSTATVSSGTLKIVGDDLDFSGDAFDVHDDGPGTILVSNRFKVLPGRECVSVTANSARCTGVTRKIRIDAKSGLDSITLQSALPVDILDSRGPQFGQDTVKTGPTPDGPVRFVGKGKFTIDYSARTMPLSITLDGTANDGATGEKDNIAKNVDVIGGAGNDHVVGSTDSINKLSGGAGNDILESHSFLTTLRGGNGDDQLKGGPGTDYLYGDAGNDTIDGSTGTDLLDGGDGNDALNSKDGIWDSDVDCGAGTDNLVADPATPTRQADATKNCEHVSF